MSGGRPDYRASDNPEWQPYRDPDTGEVVTITPAQCHAILQALTVWLRVASKDGNDYIREAVTEARHAWYVINGKSCLMGRLLYDGKPPLVDAPPLKHAAPDYSVEVPR